MIISYFLKKKRERAERRLSLQDTNIADLKQCVIQFHDFMINNWSIYNNIIIIMITGSNKQPRAKSQEPVKPIIKK